MRENKTRNFIFALPTDHTLSRNHTAVSTPDVQKLTATQVIASSTGELMRMESPTSVKFRAAARGTPTPVH